MVSTAMKERFERGLDRLSPEQQWRVLGFVEGLSASKPEPTPGSVFLRFAGVISAEDGEAMERAIEEGCERVDEGDW